MRGRMLGTGVRGPLAVIMTVAAFGCGPSPITSARIEAAIEPLRVQRVVAGGARTGLEIAVLGCEREILSVHIGL